MNNKPITQLKIHDYNKMVTRYYHTVDRLNSVLDAFREDSLLLQTLINLVGRDVTERAVELIEERGTHAAKQAKEEHLIILTKDLADNIMDFLYGLQCEWNWKKNCGYPKPEEDYKELIATIERFKKTIGK